MSDEPIPALPEFRLTSVTTSPFEPRRRSRVIEEDEVLSKVREHLTRNMDRRVPLTEAAKVAGFERTYFSYYFRKKVGITYVRWANAMRVARAIDLLRNTEETVAWIGGAVGYSDLRTFERNFKRLTGQTPSIFRSEGRRRELQADLDRRQLEARGIDDD